MQYAVTLPPFEAWSDPHAVMTMAAEAERAGWDGFFLWDHVTWNPAWGPPPAMADAWTCIALAATVTQRIRLGAMVTPVARRRVEHFARQLTTIDRIANGRIVLGVGLGDDHEYTAFGEELRHRGSRLDDSLAVLRKMLSGEAVVHEGRHLRVDAPPMRPAPLQSPIPIWIGGGWPNPRPFERARRFDGVIPRSLDPTNNGYVTASELRAIRATIGRTDGFDYVASGTTASPDDAAHVGELRAAGATWWVESLHPWGSIDSMIERLRAGPPRL